MQSDPNTGAMASQHGLASQDGFASEAPTNGAAALPASLKMNWILIPIIAASGFAGLGYEIVWTRQLALALGTEMMAVLGAVAGFFGGLALGAFVLDRPIRRAKSPRAAYAALEVVIGL